MYLGLGPDAGRIRGHVASLVLHQKGRGGGRMGHLLAPFSKRQVGHSLRRV